MCAKAAKDLPKSERPQILGKILDLLEENPVDSIVDTEESKLELEKWVGRDGQLYIEFDTKLRQQLNRDITDVALLNYLCLESHFNNKRLIGFRRMIGGKDQ